ncbi:Condensin-2 complex subunit H2 [Bienertia sinuspersici]
MAWECGYRRVIAESECLSLIAKVKKEAKSNLMIGMIVHDILNLVSFSHVKRQGNSLAHYIASSNVSSYNEFVWLEDFPDYATNIACQQA